MNVVGHDREGMQNVVFEDSGVVLDGFDYHVGDGRLPQVKWPGTGFIQQAIHGGKCMSGVESCRRGSPVAGQTVMETPGEEDGLVRLIIVRKSSPIEGYTRIVRRERRFSHPWKRPTRGSAADEGVRPTQQPDPQHFHVAHPV